MDIQTYLDRIHVGGITAPDLATLETLHQQHLLHIPFENIDIQNKIPISLDPEAVYNKVVRNRRGGYCYELNSLFCRLLRQSGYQVEMIACRVSRGHDFGAAFDHMALLVYLDNHIYLADVGFGSFTMKPLLLTTEREQYDGRERFQIRDYGMIDGERYYAAEKSRQGRSQRAAVYIFSCTPHAIQAFEEMNRWQQTHPGSHFVQNFICSKPTEQGRISMINHYFTETEAGRKKQRIVDDAERSLLLQQYFDITLQPSAATCVPD